MNDFVEHLANDVDEIKIFECDKHDDDDHHNRLSPLIKDDEIISKPTNISINLSDRFNNEHQFGHFFPYFNGPFHQPAPPVSLEKPMNLTSLIESNAGFSNGIYPTSNYSNNWRPNTFPFAFSSAPNPSENFSSTNKRTSTTSSQSRRQNNETSSKKCHIKKPLNAFMLFMKEQRSQVVQECTLRESAAINQILGRKWHELDRDVQQKYYDMARNERLRHMQLYPGWSARDNYGVKKKRTIKGKKRDRTSADNAECLNQKKCRARFGLDQQSNWCKHCKRKKKCLRYTENETVSVDPQSWSEDNDTDQIEDSNDDEDLNSRKDSAHLEHSSFPTALTSMDSDEENKLRMMNHSFSSSASNNFVDSTINVRKDLNSTTSFFRPYFHPDNFFHSTTMGILADFHHDH